MSIKRILAVGLVLALACVGWWILGAATAVRSTTYLGRLNARVEQLWGTPLIQVTPSFTVQIPGAEQARHIMPSANNIRVGLQTDYRKKGLIWYPTYNCSFSGAYTITNDEAVAQKVRVHFDFPSAESTYDDFGMSIGGLASTAPVDTEKGIDEIIELGPNEAKVFQIGYKTRGMTDWRYRMDPALKQVRNILLEVKTNFPDVDYPEDGRSPASAVPSEDGMLLKWQAGNLIMNQDIGVIIPEKLNPGPLTSRITFFAPVCLIFFFVLIGTINILYRVDIHPMHYFFVAAGFFAFHLLLAYMAGIVHINIAFAIAAVVSIALVTSYLSAALRGQFPWKVAAAGQIFFLVLFSYSFFFEGKTGLTVAVGSVITLAVLMRVTAHVDWNEVFLSRRNNRNLQKLSAVAPAVVTPPALPQV